MAHYRVSVFAAVALFFLLVNRLLSNVTNVSGQLAKLTWARSAPSCSLGSPCPTCDDSCCGFGVVNVCRCALVKIIIYKTTENYLYHSIFSRRLQFDHFISDVCHVHC